MKSILKWCMAAAFASAATTAMAQFPERPITLLVPFDAGGTTDIIGRAVADHLSEALGSPVAVENRGGGGGTIGSALVANAEPDGYTLLLATAGTHSINPNLRDVEYDPIADFAPISLAVETPVLLVVSPDLEAETLEELIALGQAEPGRLNFASAGNGSMSHLAGELFNQLTGAGMEHIPYPGAGPAMNDVLAGRVEVFMNNMPPLVPHVESGALRALAVASPERSSILPDVPTAIEAGLDFTVSGWFGVLAPAGTPDEIIQTLHAAMAKMESSDALKERMLNLGSEVVTSASTEEFATYIDEKLARFAVVVEKADASID